MKFLIIEDEQRIAARTERMIRRNFGEDLIQVTIIDNLLEGIQYIDSNDIDVLFLDLNLNGEDGFQVLKTVVAKPFQTIVISAYKNRAIEAFEYGVLDFIAKPYNEDRFIKACKRIEIGNRKESKIKYLSVKKRINYQLIPIHKISYIKGAGIYSELYLEDGSKELHSKNLESLALLLPEGWLRIHKSYLVSLHSIKSLIKEPGSKYSVQLHNEIVLPVGRTKFKEIQNIIN